MKQRIYNGHPLEFFDSSNDKKAEIKISGSDLILNPLDSSGTVIIGEAGTINDIEVGAVGTAVDFTFLGGGTLTSNGGTLTIGASGDTIDLSNTTIAAISASVFTGSFVGDGTNLINVVPDLSSYSGNVGVTGNLTVTGKITAEEFHTEFVSASIIYNSGSTKFGDTHDDVHDFTGSINVKASGSTRSVVIDSVSGFGRIRASSASFFLGGGAGSTLIQAQNDFVPDGDSTRDLGSTGRYWAELYVDEAKLGNDSSHTHIVTGSINMKTGNLLVNMNKGGYIEADYDDSTGSLKFADGTRAKFGTGNDLHIYHDGANSYIHEAGTGDLYLRGGNDLIIQDSVGNTAIHINDSNTVELTFGGSKKFETKTDGILVTGNISGSNDLHVAGDASFRLIKAISGSTTDGHARSYTWRAVENTSNTSNQYYKIATVSGGQSSRFRIDLVGRSTSYSDHYLPAIGTIAGQLNNDNNYDIIFYNNSNYSASLYSEVIAEAGQVDNGTSATDIYIRLGQYAEIAATAVVSDTYINTFSNNAASGSATEPTGYAIAVETKVLSVESSTDGKVGIGVNAAIRKLHVNQPTTYLGRFSYDANNFIEIGYDSFNIKGGNLFFRNDGSTLMTLTTGGSLGIGTTSPDHRIHLTGSNVNIKLEGDGSAGAPITSIFLYRAGVKWSLLSGTGGANRFDIRDDANSASRFTLNSAGKLTLGAYGSGTHTGTAAYNIQVDSSGNIIESAVGGGGTIDGSGSGSRIAIWSDADTLTSDTDFTVNADCLFSTNAAISNKLSVKSATTHSLFDFYNNGTSYFNGDVTVDANFTQTTGTTASFSGDIFLPASSALKFSTDLIISHSANTLKFIQGGSSNRFSISGDVHVLGATDFAIPAGRKLYLDGQSNTYITETSDGVIDFYGDGVQLLTAKQNGTQSEVIVNEGSGDVDFRVEANKYSHALFVEAEASGSVGIGTNDPAEKLHVYGGNVLISGSSAGTELKVQDGASGAPIRLSSNGSGEAFLYIGGENSSLRRTGGDLNLFANSLDIKLSTNNGSYPTMFLSTTHNVGIGTTNTSRVNSNGSFFQPDENGRFLVVNHNSGSFIMLETNSTTAGDQVGGIYFNKTGNQSDAHLQVAGIDAILADHSTNNLQGGELRFFTKVAGAGDTSHHMVLDHLGKLGIGQNANPSVTLHVTSSENELARFESSDNNAHLRLSDDNTNVYVVAEDGIAGFGLQTSLNANNLNVNSSGRVGIGTTAPDRRLHVQTSDDVVAHFESSDATARIDVSDNTVHTRIGAQASQSFFGPYTSYASSGVLRIYSASFNANDDGYASFGTAGPSVNHKLRIGLNPNTSDDIPQSGVTVDLNLGGSSALSSDRNYRGFISDIDSTATGGDTTNESRLYGFYADVNDQGSSDLNYGFYAQVQNRNSAGSTTTELAGIRTSTLLKHTSGSITNGYGAYFSVNATQDGGTLGSLYGIRTEVTTGDTDKATDNSFGGYFRNIPGSSLSANWGHARGVYAEVQWDPSTTLTNGTAVQANIDSNAGTITNAYQFKGATTKAGTITNSYGIYSDGADKHYFSGKVGIATTSPQATLSIGDNIGSFNGMSIGATANRDIRIGQASSYNLVIGWKYNVTASSAYSIIENFGGNNPLYLQGSGGNVAIGTITPDDVGGTSKLTVDVGTGQGSFRLQNGSTDGVYFRRNTTGGKYQLQTTFGNSNAGVLSLQSYGGDVGIGTVTPDGSIKLTVNSDTNFIASFKNNLASNPAYGVNRFSSGSTVIANYGWRNQGSFSPQVLSGNGHGEFFIRGDKGIALISNNTASISISEAADVVMGDSDNTPRLLIGTGSAETNSKIHIHGDNNYIRFSSNAGTLAAEIGNDSSGDGVMLLREDSDNNVKIKLYAEQGGSSFIDNDSGKFGLFTSSPQAELHVVGDAIVTGKLTAQEFHTEFVSASILYDSGSTKFGDTSDDVHDFTGSVNIKDGNIDIKATDPTITLLDTAGANTDPNGRIVFSETAGFENFDINYNGSSDRLEFRGRIGSNDNTDLVYINRDTTTTLNVLGGGTFAGNVSVNGQLNVGDSNADILQVGLKSVVAYGENTDVDTGTETIKELAIATYQAAFFDFVIKKGSNIRAGTLTAAHDGTNVEFNEVSTVDLGDTTDVKLSVDISSGNMRLRATTLSNDWSVKAFVRAIKV